MSMWQKAARPHALAVLIALFFLLDRLLSSGFLLPWFCIEDERRIQEGAVKMVREASLDPGTHKYPELMFILTAGMYGAGCLGGNLMALPGFVGGESFSWRRAHYPFDFVSTITWGRRLVAAMGAAALIVFYLLARREFGEDTALAAMLLFATAPAFLFSTQFLKAEALLMIGVLLVVWTSLGVLERGSRLDYLLAGAAAGLCLAAKYHAPAFVPLLLAHRLHHRELSAFKAFRKTGWIPAIACALLVFAILSPHTWLDLPGAVQGIGEEIAIQHADPLLLRSTELWWQAPVLFQFSSVLPLALGIPLFLAAMAGIIWKTELGSPRVMVIWSYPAGMLAFMIAMSNLGSPHLYVTVVPFFALAAAMAAAPWLGSDSRWQKALCVVVIGALAGCNLLFYHGFIKLEDSVIRGAVIQMRDTHQEGEKDLALVPYYPNPSIKWNIMFAPQFVLSPEIIEDMAPDRILVHHAFFNAYLDNPELTNKPRVAAMVLYYMELRAGRAGYREADRWTGQSFGLSVYQRLFPDLTGLRASIFEKETEDSGPDGGDSY